MGYRIAFQMYTIWSVRADGGSGKELYGEGYADIYALNRLHYKAASTMDCDHVSVCVSPQLSRE